MHKLEQTIAQANAISRELADRGMPGSIRKQFAIVLELLDAEFSAATGVEHMAYELLIATCNAAEENLVYVANKNKPTEGAACLDEGGEG
jgi:hypothetical protein